jgi:uncharacterized membrane protein
MRSIAKVTYGTILFLLLSSSAFADSVGFVYTLGTNSFAPFQFPGATQTSANGINDAGQIVGGYYPSFFGFSHGYVKDGNAFTTLDYPGAYDTNLFGINNAGLIVGTQVSSPSGGSGIPRQCWFLHVVRVSWRNFHLRGWH